MDTEIIIKPQNTKLKIISKNNEKLYKTRNRILPVAICFTATNPQSTVEFCVGFIFGDNRET